METYRRQIKFCYYKVAKIEINENEQSHVVGKFNLNCTPCQGHFELV